MMTVKNLGALIGVVLISGTVLAVSGGRVTDRVSAAAAPRIERVTSQTTRPAPLESKRQSVEPVGQRSRITTNAEREPIVPERHAGTTAPTGATC
ncbi:hypothetical protein [Levilactobacillus suantsaiihabitans]|uniref:Uncharacterized protein n=1 Tax=Levilactobacillus suantsaiihabitans TaxID=2487722 RepID=A0A4Z0J8H2_9LACO|nr:hypothetical protein [Levilactobacillus suantsaiihabitans]TGD18250.1 hypothetical protein EGT51_09435 [Levilactobacillus suantsaiihabitans]